MAQVTVQQAFDLAVQHQLAGRYDDAARLYQQILAHDPNHLFAMHNLGVLAHLAGQQDLAERLLRRVVALKPDFPEALDNLGSVLRSQGHFDQAISLSRQAIAMRPDFAQGYFNLANALKDKGQLDEAIAAFRQTIGLHPNYAEAHCNLGVALKAAGQVEDAIASYRRAIALRPDLALAHFNLANALKDTGQLAEAIAAFREAIRLNPNYLEAHCNLGTALRAAGQSEDAITSYRQAIALSPNFANAYSGLGNALRDVGRIDEAIAAYRQEISLRPDDAKAHSQLGVVLRDAGQIEDAVAACKRAIALNPGLASAHANLANALKDQGKLDESIAAAREAIRLDPNDAASHSNLIYTLQFHPSCSAQAIADEHRRWATRHADPLRPANPRFSNSRDPNRPLRIGYVSGHFHDHAVAMFSYPMIEAHDRQQFQVHLYSAGRKKDDFTQKFRSLANEWRDIVPLDDQAAAELVRHDQIDILVDLAGHIGGNRLLLFARKPAPIQIAYLGYQATTGMEAIDYRLTDAIADPPGQTDAFYVEQLIRLPQFFVYRPSDDAPTVSALPAEANGYITFGCLNMPSKINEPVVALWARILHAVPQSRLLMLAPGSSDAHPHVRQMFESHGISTDRLQFAGKRPRLQYLELFARFDIALDPFPFSGHTTTCDTLWQGVPVITLAGKTYASRMTASTLHHANLANLVAQTPEQYVQHAVELASYRPALAQMRRTMRDHLRAAPMLDAARFTQSVESAYRALWQRWCTQGDHSAISAG